MSEDVKEPTNEQIITLDDKEYKYLELSEEAKTAVNQLNVIEMDIQQTKMLLGRHEAAKITFVKYFRDCVEPEETETE
jgi:hypothetical protein